MNKRNIIVGMMGIGIIGASVFLSGSTHADSIVDIEKISDTTYKKTTQTTTEDVVDIRDLTARIDVLRLMRQREVDRSAGLINGFDSEILKIQSEITLAQERGVLLESSADEVLTP